MTTAIIIASLFIVWYLLGFWPGRAIRRKNNRWHAWGPGKQIWGYIDGDKNRFLPDPMPPGFRAQSRLLTYTKYVEDGKVIAYDEPSKDGKKINYHAAQEIAGIKKPIRFIDEEVFRLRKTEIHPFIITVTMPKSGLTFYLNFTAKIKLFDPKLTLLLDNFLSFFGNELNDAVYPWAVLKEAEWIEEKGLDPKNPGEVADLVVDQMLGLKIDDPKSIMIVPDQLAADNVTVVTPGKNLLEYLNTKIEPFGMRNAEFSLDVGYDKKVEGILDLRNKQVTQEEQTKLQVKANETRGKVREMEKADEDQNRSLDKLRVDEVVKPTLIALGEMREKSNGAWKPGVTLFQGEADDNKQVTGMLAGILTNTQKTGGQNATQPNNP